MNARLFSRISIGEKILIGLSVVYIIIMLFTLNLGRNSNLVVRSFKQIEEEERYLFILEEIYNENLFTLRHFNDYIHTRSRDSFVQYEQHRRIVDVQLTALQGISSVYTFNTSYESLLLLDSLDELREFEDFLLDNVSNGRFGMNIVLYDSQYVSLVDDVDRILIRLLEQRRSLLQTLKQTNSEHVQYFQGSRIGILLATPIFTIIVLLFISNTVSTPIKKLEQTAAEFAKGNFSKRVDIETGDEIGKLAKVFNDMAKNLQTRTKELEQSKKDLEQEVRKRTRELNKQVDELERITNIMVDRELKMVQLKKELSNIKSKK
ncbi:HAMP domain-containing protein [Candidatus Dojkabacteria bacterium]|uniref:histidine kinase n=1 Tax=Candidatus Dojkabacteria bacterium TaxID=2099670 RepID=A0A955L6Y6_9BACT|nr:HAMP domain-containing protein [Candidatus Dojkabacteria bacterium]